MKFVFRLFFALVIAVIILSAFGVFLVKIVSREELGETELNWGRWMFVGAGLLALLSFPFGILKFLNDPKNNRYYKIIRVGDLIFCLYLFVFSMMILGNLMIDYISVLGTNYRIIIPVNTVVFYTFFGLFSIALFVDNIKFHKSLIYSQNHESINDIGKGA